MTKLHVDFMVEGDTLRRRAREVEERARAERARAEAQARVELAKTELLQDLAACGVVRLFDSQETWDCVIGMNELIKSGEIVVRVVDHPARAYRNPSREFIITRA